MKRSIHYTMAGAGSTCKPTFNSLPTPPPLSLLRVLKDGTLPICSAWLELPCKPKNLATLRDDRWEASEVEVEH